MITCSAELDGPRMTIRPEITIGPRMTIRPEITIGPWMIPCPAEANGPWMTIMSEKSIGY
jgi:hypothetical protein